MLPQIDECANVYVRVVLVMTISVLTTASVQFTPTTYWIVANEFTRFVTWSKSRISEERRTAVITRAERKIRRRGIVPRIAPVEQADIKASIVQPSRQAGGQAVGQAGRQAGRQAGGI